MALTNYERQKRWREKNRAIYNLRRRNKRKDLSGQAYNQGEVVTAVNQPNDARHGVEIPPPAQPSEVERLRELMKRASAEPTLPVVKPVIFRDDSGRVISERQWNVLQKLKAKAKAGGYELDDFIQ